MVEELAALAVLREQEVRLELRLEAQLGLKLDKKAELQPEWLRGSLPPLPPELRELQKAC